MASHVWPLLYWKTSLWALFFLLACLWSAGDINAITPPIPHIDKLAHFGFSAGLAALLVADMVMRPWVALLLGAGFGGLIELFQQVLSETRSAEWMDMGADFIGVLVGVAFGLFYIKQFGTITHKSLWRCFFP